MTYFMARSNLVACVLEWEKLLQSKLDEEKLAGQKIFISDKKFDLRGFSAPAKGLYTCICPLFFEHLLLLNH